MEVLSLPRVWNVKVVSTASGPSADIAAMPFIHSGAWSQSMRPAQTSCAGRLIVARSTWVVGAPLFEGRVNDSGVHVQIDRLTEGYRLTHGSASAEDRVRTSRAAELAARMPKKASPDLSKYLLSPMPGMVVSVSVAAGDKVKAGEELCVVDAMKMENVLRAERDATVSDVKVDAGDSLAVGQVILEFA